MRQKRPGPEKGPAKKLTKASNQFEFHKTVLPSGLRILTERHPVSRAVSCGVWITKGTRDEASQAEAGAAHFIEHLVFKRTKRRSAFEIARDMEAVGGDLNAFTSRESTCYLTHSLHEHVGLSLDVLSDLVCRPKFDPHDIKKEKHVVLQEIHMAEDQLEDNIFDRYFDLIYPGDSIGKPILGTKESISKMKRDTIIDFHNRHYRAANIVVSVTGKVAHDEVVELIAKHLKLPAESKVRNEAAKTEPTVLAKRPELKAFRKAIRRPSEQAHVLIGLPASEFRAHLRFEAYIVNTLLGGGMTSRLYQSVREDRGLVYSIYSQLVTFIDAGQMLIYAGCEPKEAPVVVELIFKEIKKLRRSGISKRELEFFKTQVKGQILLGADDIDVRMNSLAVNEMVFGKYRSVDDVIADIERVSPETVEAYIEMYIDPERMGMLLMGAVPEAPTRKWLESL
jgi:predicted Zn-dependent peptidase